MFVVNIHGHSIMMINTVNDILSRTHSLWRPFSRSPIAVSTLSMFTLGLSALLVYLTNPQKAIYILQSKTFNMETSDEAINMYKTLTDCTALRSRITSVIVFSHLDVLCMYLFYTLIHYLFVLIILYNFLNINLFVSKRLLNSGSKRTITKIWGGWLYIGRCSSAVIIHVIISWLTMNDWTRVQTPFTPPALTDPHQLLKCSHTASSQSAS